VIRVEQLSPFPWN
jgi:2-oxoglutarate dehydrogenase E1 component